MAPFKHYLGIYGRLDPDEIARRCALRFDAGQSAFALRVMGAEYLVPFPDFEMKPLAGQDFCSRSGRLLFLRYLCEGSRRPETGRQISYDQIPWGEVYYRNFRGRCVDRLTRAFGGDIQALTRLMEENPGLRAEKLKQGDAGYRFEFIDGLYMSVILWEGDDEFPPSSQILFSDNFPAAFAAEDIAVAAELAIGALSSQKNRVFAKGNVK